ncbi:MAG: hypothetical protein AAF514_05310, partial [Verrucomicrobiota bacterium]
MNPGTSAIVTFAIYLLVVAFLAWLAGRQRSGKGFIGEYFLGSRNLGMWALALTFAATSASGGSFMGFPALIYSHGWVLALWIAGYMLVPLVGMGLLGKRLNLVARRAGAVTIPEILRRRFRSGAVGTLATLLVVVFFFFYLLAQFKAGSEILAALLEDVPAFQQLIASVGSVSQSLPWIGATPPDYLVCLVLFAVSVIAYVVYGGFRAVVWTDVLQGVVMVVGVFVMLFLVLSQVGGLGKATTELSRMTPPVFGEAVLVRSGAIDEASSLRKGSWVRLEGGGVVKLNPLEPMIVLEAGQRQAENIPVLQLTTPN